MAYFAKIENNLVTQVIVATQEVIDSGSLGEGWLKTSYNTFGGVHYGVDGKPDGGVPLRKNFAGIGYLYDSNADAFYPPSPHHSWILDKDSYLWTSPTPYPNNGNKYMWDEPTLTWKLFVPK